jgi:glycosyltransferase involved in cell wall biosynthesis
LHSGIHADWQQSTVRPRFILSPDGLPEREAVFVAAGSELEKAGSFARQILTSIQRSRVSFLAGASRDTGAELLSPSHIYVSLSRPEETFLFRMEVLASGALPVSEIPASQEWIEPESKNSLLAPYDDAPELAKALTRAIKDILRSAVNDKKRQ